MLHIYDVPKSPKLLALAAAIGLSCVGPAQAQQACHLDNGYAVSLSAYAAEMQSCVAEMTPQNVELAAALLDAINQQRATAQLAPLKARTSLNHAAQAHGLDMAQRKFVDHLDLEGRDHLYRIRTLDRTQLTGATGANVVLVPAGLSAADLFARLQEDELNRDNLTRDAFTHIGIGLIENSGRLFVTLLFTEMEGELKRALPVNFDNDQRIRAKFTNPRDQAIGWGLTNLESQEQYARGINPLLTAERVQNVPVAGLSLYISSKTAVKNVRGPMISATEY